MQNPFGYMKHLIKKIIAPAFLLSLFQQPSFSQNPQYVDSLTNEFKTHSKDTTAANILYALSKAHWGNDPDKAMDYAQQSLTLAESISFNKGIAKACYSMGIINSDWGEYPEALRLQEKALTINKEINYQPGIADAYNEIGLCDYYMGNNPDALKNYLASIKINEALGNKQAAAGTYMNLGNVYNNTFNFNEALKNHQLSLKAFKEIGLKRGIAMAYNNIAGVYSRQNKYADALVNLEESKKIKEELGDKRGLANVYGNIANINSVQNNYAEALKNFTASMQLQEEIGDKNGLCSSYINIGKSYEKQEKYKEALAACNKGLQMALETGNKNAISDVYSALTRINAKLKNYKEAYDYSLLYKQAYDSLFNSENDKKLTQMQMQFDFDKKEAATKAEQDKKDALTKAEIAKQKIIFYFSIAGVIGILLAGSYMFYNFRKRKKLENLQALSSERLRISRELHDDIGSTLGSIAVYSDVAKNRSLKNGNPADVLPKIGTASRELIEKMSDIVWSLNPDNESFDQLQNRMQAFAAMILTSQDIAFEFKNEGELKTVQLTNEQRKNIFLIYKEAIHNSVKYAGCKNVLISFSKQGNRLTFLIKDDGKGFDALAFEQGKGEAYNGNGLNNMKARAAEMKASFSITSVNNEGATVELKLG